MSRIYVKCIINPPDDEHCLNPKSRRKFEHCKFMNWMPRRDDIKYKCDIYQRKLYKRKDGTIKRPKFCRDSEV